MEKRVVAIMAKVFGIDENEINESSSVNTIKQWDSLRHMQMVIALEGEFDVEIDSADIMQMINYHQVIVTIKKLLDRNNR